MKRLTRKERAELWPWAIVALLMALAVGQIFPGPMQFAYYIGAAAGLTVGLVTIFVVPEDAE